MAKRPNDRFMKKLLFVGLTIGTTLSAQAQLLSPDSLTGAMLGAFIGGVAGSDCHNSFSGNGAAIGAGVGLVVGTIAGQVRQNQAAEAQPQPAYFAAQPAYVVTQPSLIVTSTGSPPVYTTQYVTFVTNVYVAPVPVHAPPPPPPPRPNYAVGGTLLGAASGALIGSGIHHQAAEGAAIGASAGLLVGGAAEYATKKHEQTVASTQSAPPPQTKPTIQQSPKAASANTKPAHQTKVAKLQSTSDHQIADAPRVPDARTF